MGALKRFLRYQYLKVIRLRDEPHKVATGMALGIFVAFTPTVPLQTYIALGLALLFRGSLVAAMAGVWLSNPLNLAFFYYLDYLVGRWVLGWNVIFKPRDFSLFTLFTEAEKLFALMTVGGLIMGIPAGIIAYFLTYRAVTAAKRRRERRLGTR